MLLIRSIKINKSYLLFSSIVISILLILIVVWILYPISLPANSSDLIWENTVDSDEISKKSYIKWVDFNATFDVLDKTSKLDINSHNNGNVVTYNWIELLILVVNMEGILKNLNKQI